MRGGKRKGSGRKKGFSALTSEKAREYITKRVTEELEPIMDKAIAQAKDGDQAARKDLMDRAYGKPKETVEHTGEVNLLLDV